jgi:hypothetical protein
MASLKVCLSHGKIFPLSFNIYVNSLLYTLRSKEPSFLDPFLKYENTIHSIAQLLLISEVLIYLLITYVMASLQWHAYKFISTLFFFNFFLLEDAYLLGCCAV